MRMAAIIPATATDAVPNIHTVNRGLEIIKMDFFVDWSTEPQASLVAMICRTR